MAHHHTAHVARLVRLQDRLALRGLDSGPVWRLNPRTGFLESRAGLSWTGVREYRTPTGVLRVLRRPSQVNSPGHLRTLRRLPVTDGHPAGDVDVSVVNERELKVGETGDRIAVEDCGGYPRPVGDITVSRLRTIAKMVDRETWEKLLALFPDAGEVAFVEGAPLTGTSLGYNALWYGPHIDAEIVGERDDGEGLIGAWDGPNGPEQYDVEHVVDPDCEIVRMLVEEQGFDPSQLGGNHFAVALAELGGRGAEQSELMRIVDSRDVIVNPVIRSRSRGALQRTGADQVKERDAVKWTVGADRDLPIDESGAWDGDAAKASVFAWAGFDEDDGKPDETKARRAFLIYDADAPELRGSYKLPIASYSEGELRVSAAGLRAAASRLPQTDAPQDVLDRARDVLDHYFEKSGAAAQRDALNTKDTTMTTETVQAVEIGCTRDVATKLQKRGIAVPATLTYTTDMIDAGKIREVLSNIMSTMAELMDKLGEAEDAKVAAEGEVAAKTEEMADMVSAEEAAKMVEEIKAKLAEAEAALVEAKKAEGEAKKASDSLTAELAPLRAAAFADLQERMLAAGVDKDKVAGCKDAADLRRVVLIDKFGDRYAVGSATDSVVSIAFDVFATMSKTTDSNSDDKGKKPLGAANDGKPAGSSFDGFPAVVPGKSRDSDDGNTQPPTTAETMGASMSTVLC